MSTSLRATARTFVPQSQIMERYYYLISLCCSSMEPHRDDEGVETFLDGCKDRLARYPTQEQLYASITDSSRPTSLLHVKDYAPQLDFAIRAMCGWDTDGVPDYVTALNALMEITALGKYTTVRDRRVALRSPSWDTCGRANALAAWAYYQLLLTDAPCCNPMRLRRQEMPRTGYRGPPQHQWRFFLYAVAHAADAARQKMVCRAVLEVGYRFRHLANVLRYLIPNHDYMTPLLVALRRYDRSERGVRAANPTDLPHTLIFQGQEEQIKDQVKQWVADMDQELKDYPNPFSEGKIGTPFHYWTINGDLNE